MLYSNCHQRTPLDLHPPEFSLSGRLSTSTTHSFSMKIQRSLSISQSLTSGSMNVSARSHPRVGYGPRRCWGHRVTALCYFFFGLKKFAISLSVSFLFFKKKKILTQFFPLLRRTQPEINVCDWVDMRCTVNLFSVASPGSPHSFLRERGAGDYCIIEFGLEWDDCNRSLICRLQLAVPGSLLAGLWYPLRL
ncbi:hypothetical protein EDD16DRAFT_364241 [Pisolithus croceorrhizus]|nr:hypothetical protein EDD16DRAFT_364241 [Pisolithus croceorrhizus]